jgi:hypothetical protein
MGAPIQIEILEDIIGFFKVRFVGTFASIQSGNVTLQFLTNSNINAANATYNGASKSFTIQVTEPPGTIGSLNVAVPKASIDGQVVVLVDNIAVDAPTSTDANTYHVYLTYPEGRHVILIGGQNTVPEFTDQLHQLLAFVTSVLILVVALQILKRGRDKFREE